MWPPYAQDVCWSSQQSSADCNPKRRSTNQHLLSSASVICIVVAALKPVHSARESGLTYCACGFGLLW